MPSFQSIYNKLEYKIKSAVARLAELQKENAELQKENAILKQRQKDLEREVAGLNEKMKLMVITKTVLNKQDKNETKKQINDWVREIDNCIALLTNKQNGREQD